MILAINQFSSVNLVYKEGANALVWTMNGDSTEVGYLGMVPAKGGGFKGVATATNLLQVSGCIAFSLPAKLHSDDKITSCKIEQTFGRV